MNTITRIATNIVTRIANINLNVKNVKEDKTMYAKINTNTNDNVRIARRAASLFAIGAMLLGAHTTAKADIELYRFIPPAEAQYAPSGMTYMELKVGNTFDYTVSGLQFIIPLSTAPQAQLGGAGDWANITSPVFSLSPHESKWIYVAVPARGALGTAFYGKQLSGAVYLNEQLLQNVHFVDVLPAANVQAVGRMTGQVMQQGTGGQVRNAYVLTFTNNGYANAAAQTVTVSTQQYAEGPIGTPYIIALTVPALIPGQSYQFSVYSQITNGKDIRGTVLNSANTVIGTF